MGRHDRCTLDDHCGEPSCEAAQCARKREDTGTPWHALEVRRGPGGLRHYLAGDPVHCGAGIALQCTEARYDDFGGYTVHLDAGERVRYEASILADGIRATLHVLVAGTVFVARLEPWMRFRWPAERA